MSEAEGDLWNLVTAYNNVGVVEYGRGNFHAAVEYFEKSVRIDEKIGAVEHEALARENLGDALELLGRWDEALEQYRKCVALEGFDDTRASRLSVYVPLARITKKDADELSGRTDNNRVVNFPGPASFIGEFVEVSITSALPHSLRGEIA